MFGQLYGCATKPNVDKDISIRILKDGFFTFSKRSDTTWQYTYNRSKKRVIKTKNILSTSDNSILEHYKLYQKENYIYLKIKNSGKVVYEDSLFFLGNRFIQGYSFGSLKYDTKSRIYGLDSAFNKNKKNENVVKNYYVVIGMYLNEDTKGFSRFFIRKKDLVITKIEICKKETPECPHTIIQ